MVKYEFYAKNPGTVLPPDTTTTTSETTTTTSETTTATVSETTTTAIESETTTSSESGLSVTVIGDANLDGKCSVADAVAILQNVANKDRFELKPQGKVNGDVDGIAGITANDALVIQKVDAGTLKPEDLPLKAA
jgi:exo-beta-1,3-glucanase (GH17 family)